MDPEPDAERRQLPRRDIVLLPLLVLLTLAMVLGGAEVATRILYPSQEADACFINRPDASGQRFKPNCTARIKVAEGPWTTAAYNACGYRTPQACGPTPPGARRVAVIGSSTAAGYLVSYDETFAARSARELSQACGQPVEFQNLAGAGYNGIRVIPRADEALGLKPDALVMIMTVVDMEQADKDNGPVAAGPPPPPPSLMARLKEIIWASRALYMEQYFLLNSDETYLPFYLKVASKAGFMQTPMPAVWRRRIVDADRVIGAVADRAKAQDVPFVLIFAPPRPSAAMTASGRSWSGFDPYAMPRALQASAERHGAEFIDATRALPRGAATRRIYYTVNGHMNGRGHKILSDAFVARVTAGPGEPFGRCTPASTPETPPY
jgi:hypothetical protein